jgi:hypothetical protein
MDFDKLAILLMTFILSVILVGMGFSEYMNYLSGKETRDLIREAISKNMTVESINTLVK